MIATMVFAYLAGVHVCTIRCTIGALFGRDHWPHHTRPRGRRS